jgi:hypothetical protein
MIFVRVRVYACMCVYVRVCACMRVYVRVCRVCRVRRVYWVQFLNNQFPTGRLGLSRCVLVGA